MKYTSKLILNWEEYQFAEWQAPENRTVFDFTQGSMPSWIITNCSLVTGWLDSPGYAYISISEDLTNKKLSLETEFYEPWQNWADLSFWITTSNRTSFDESALRIYWMQWNSWMKWWLYLMRFDSNRTETQIYSWPTAGASIYADLPAWNYIVWGSYDFSNWDYHAYLLDEDRNVIVEWTWTYADNASVVTALAWGQYKIWISTWWYLNAITKYYKYIIS